MTAAAPGAATPRRPHPDGLSRAELARAVPPGSRRVRDQREALRIGLSCPELADVRADFRRSLEAWWRLHVGHTSWGGQGQPPRGITARLSRDTVRRQAMTGRPKDGKPQPMSISVWKRCHRWWAERGYVGTVREGTTPELERRRRGVLYELAPLDGNQTPVYVLCVPRAAARRPDSRAGEIVETRNGPPSMSRRDVVIPARARPAAKPGTSPDRDRPRTWPLRGISDGWWAHLTGPFTAAGWSTRDLAWAIDHEPDGPQHRQRLDNVRHPVGWLRWRLSRWLGPGGIPQPSPGQLRRAWREQVLADQAVRRAAREAAAREAAGVDVAARVGELRAIVAAVRYRQTSAADRAGRWALEPA